GWTVEQGTGGRVEPFFFQEPRYVFYVRSEEGSVTVQEYEEIWIPPVIILPGLFDDLNLNINEHVLGGIGGLLGPVGPIIPGGIGNVIPNLPGGGGIILNPDLAGRGEIIVGQDLIRH